MSPTEDSILQLTRGHKRPTCELGTVVIPAHGECRTQSGVLHCRGQQWAAPFLAFFSDTKCKRGEASLSKPCLKCPVRRSTPALSFIPVGYLCSSHQHHRLAGIDPSHRHVQKRSARVADLHWILWLHLKVHLAGSYASVRRQTTPPWRVHYHKKNYANTCQQPCMRCTWEAEGGSTWRSGAPTPAL